MKIIVFSIGMLIFSTFSLACSAQIIDDAFDDGDLSMNTSGVGTGFTVTNLSTGNFLEMGNTASFDGGPTGASRSFLTSNDTFDANTSDTVTATFEISDFGRAESLDDGTSRYFVGLTDQTDGGVLENQVDGLWVVLSGRELVGGAGNTIDNGNGGLFFIDGTNITELGLWTWSQDLVSWDAASLLRSDRIAQNLDGDDLTVTLTSNETGYSLSFATSGAGTLPVDISGTWADAGVTNDLAGVSAAVVAQSSLPNLVVNRVIVGDGMGGGAPVIGDVNRDGMVNFLDITPFIALLSATEFQDEADIDRNGTVDFLDITPFIVLLSS